MDVSISHMAGIASLLTLTSSLELIRTRLQTDRQLVSLGRISQTYRSIRHCLSSITRTEGLLSLWKGNTVGLARFFPSEAINYQARNVFRPHFGSDCLGNIAVAVLAGWTASSTLYPLEAIRMALSSHTSQQQAALSALGRLVRQNGPSIFYRGFAQSMAGTAVFRASFNGLYDWAKGYSASQKGRVGIAYSCSIVAGVLCYPLDSLRRKKMVANSQERLGQFARKVVAEEGVRGLYRGSHLMPVQSVVGALILLAFDSPVPKDE